MPELDDLRDVGWRLRRRLHPRGDHVLVQQRRVRGHGLLHVHDVRQHLVADLDEVQRLLRGPLADGGHRGHRMALVEDLLARHHVADDVAVVDQHLPGRHELGGEIVEVVPGDHHLHAGQGAGTGGIDRLQPGVGVGAAQHLAHQHVRQVHVRSEARAAGHLVHAVRPYRPGPDPFGSAVRLPLGTGCLSINSHRSTSSNGTPLFSARSRRWSESPSDRYAVARISAAASSTARTILS